MSENNEEDVKKIDDKFDGIILSHVFEHVVNCRDLLSIIYEKLSDNGILFLEVPNCSNKKILEHSIFEQPHIHHFTLKGFEKISENLNQPLRELIGLSEKEREKVVYTWNNTTSSFPRELCLHQQFEQMVERKTTDH